jgi:pyruvate dehydrogenase E2 component (dihydrolipoamide acetyltransferase)
MADITMPQLGETVTEGTITRWFKKVGDEVVQDEPLFEVSTAEVDTVVPESEPEMETAPEPEPQPAAAAPPAPAGGRKVLSPVVRRLLAENDLDADDIQGTGIEGRVTRNDVMAHLDKGGGRSPAPKQQPPAGRAAAAHATAVAPEARAGADEVIPFSNIRKRTAEHMVRSQATSAHVLIAMEVDYEAVDRVRMAEKEVFKAEEGFSLTYIPFVSRAVVDALRDFPHVNASVGDNELIVHKSVHLGIAVDINFEGLIVPVLHDADGKRLRSIAREISDLAGRARSKKLNADEISGSTFTITNPGGYGTFFTAAVINQPQVAILSTDGVKKRPVVVQLPDGSDAIAIHPVGTLALSFDHRAFDGAYASAFLARCRDIIETRDWSQEL